MTPKQQRNRNAYLRKVEKAAAEAHAGSPRLTINPAKASVLRCPDSGRRFPADSDMGTKCRRIFKQK